MTKRKHKYPIVSLILYIIGIIILMVEAAIPGDKSAQQSNAVGNTLADFFNDVEGDQTVAIPPESLTISNKIDTGFVGEEHQLTYEVLPKDSTYKSTVFSSSDKNVASINEDGVISFLNIGTVTISATNEHYPSINDSFTLTVYNVEATSISSSILNATIDEDVYTLSTLLPTPCIRCGRCVDICPMQLTPLMIDFYATVGDFKNALKYGAMNCFECGSCAYVCPAKRPLVQSIRLTKAKAKEIK